MKNNRIDQRLNYKRKGQAPKAKGQPPSDEAQKKEFVDRLVEEKQYRYANGLDLFTGEPLGRGE